MTGCKQRRRFRPPASQRLSTVASQQQNSNTALHALQCRALRRCIEVASEHASARRSTLVPSADDWCKILARPLASGCAQLDLLALIDSPSSATALLSPSSHQQALQSGTSTSPSFHRTSVPGCPGSLTAVLEYNGTHAPVSSHNERSRIVADRASHFPKPCRCGLSLTACQCRTRVCYIIQVDRCSCEHYKMTHAFNPQPVEHGDTAGSRPLIIAETV